jgi:hypothetical protein
MHENSQSALTKLRARTSSTEQTPPQATSGAPFTFTFTPRHTYRHKSKKIRNSKRNGRKEPAAGLVRTEDAKKKVLP